jgi:hypothetical protein
MLLLAKFLAPLVEFFDRWDPAGPGNDTEMAVFGLILVLCFVLLVCKLTASLTGLIAFLSVLRPRLSRGSPARTSPVFASVFVPPLTPPRGHFRKRITEYVKPVLQPESTCRALEWTR